VTCKAHTRRSEASTASASCACRKHQLHRYLKGHHRRSMLLRPRARRCCLANCRARSGWRSSLSAREKRARAGGKSVLCSQGSSCYPATRAKFPSTTILPRRPAACERTTSPPNHVISVFDGWTACRVGRKVYLVDYFLCCSFLASFTISIAITCPLRRITTRCRS
jgi:hypothetical protein